MLREVFTAGQDSLVITQLDAGDLSLVYTTPQASTTFRRPIPVDALRPGPLNLALVTLLRVSPVLLGAAQDALRNRSVPTDAASRKFQETLKHILQDRFIGDSMDDLDIAQRLS